MTVGIFDVGIVFLLVWISVILFVYLRSSSPNKELVKFVGGFSVILISLYAKTYEIYFVSVIIAGLIITSERFMSFLVSIIRGNKGFLTSKNFIRMIEKMSGEEIEEKNKKEIEEIKETEVAEKKKTKKSTKKPRKPTQIKKKDYVKQLPEIEKAAIGKFVEDLNLPTRGNIKLGNIYIDAIAVNRDKKKVYIIEAKVFPMLQGYTEKSISHIVEQRMKVFVPQMLLSLNNVVRIRESHPSENFVLMVLLILDTDMCLDYVKERLRLLKRLYNKPNQKVIVKFVFYNMPKLDIKPTPKK